MKLNFQTEVCCNITVFCVRHAESHLSSPWVGRNVSPRLHRACLGMMHYLLMPFSCLHKWICMAWCSKYWTAGNHLHLLRY